MAKWITMGAAAVDTIVKVPHLPKADEIVYIKPGDQVLGVRVIGIPPIPIGFDNKKGTVFLPYTF